MQIREITNINEGFWDSTKNAIKGIGSVAAQGINQAVGTNIGGAGSTAAPGIGKTQQAAMNVNTQLAKQQASQYAATFAKAVQTSTSPATLSNELERIVYNTLFSNTITDIKTLDSKVDTSVKSQATAIEQQIENAMKELLTNPTIAADAKKSLDTWISLTTGVAQARNLLKFNPVTRSSSGVPAGDITIDPVSGVMLYKGRPYDPADPIARAAMTAYLRGLPE